MSVFKTDLNSYKFLIFINIKKYFSKSPKNIKLCLMLKIEDLRMKCLMKKTAQ